MTMTEILARFVKNEPLPIEKSDAYYATGIGDLEKMARQDFTVQDEMWDHIQQSAALFKEEDLKKKKKAEDDKLEPDRPGGPVLTVPQTMAKSAATASGPAEGGQNQTHTN